MKAVGKTLAVSVAAALLAAATAGAAVQDESLKAATIDFTATDIAFFSAKAMKGDLVSVRVMDPAGNLVLETQAKHGEPVIWTLPANAADGLYRYDVYLVPGGGVKRGDDESAKALPQAMQRVSGEFEVESGMIRQESGGDNAVSALLHGAGDLAMAAVGGLLDLVVPPAAAADLTASSGVPSVFFNDTDITATGNEWVFRAIQGDPELEMVDLVNGTTFFEVSSSANSAGSFDIDLLGDILFANGAMFIDRSASRVGIGTTTPTDEVHIVNTSAGITFDEGAGSAGATWLVGESAGDFRFFLSNNYGGPTGEVLTIENDAPGPNVGIWAPNPLSSLEVGSVDGLSSQVLVRNTVAAGSDRVMFKLTAQSNDKIRFELAGSGGGNSWTFDNTPSLNQFSISKVGTGVNEFSLDANGNGTFRGNSTAVNHINTSSRASKTDFADIDVGQVLERLVSLPISQWRYKVESAAAAHVGPVAEDFKAAFGLGDGKTISTVDASGVAFAAIQGLNAKIESKDAEIERLKADNDELEARIARLESLLTGAPVAGN